MTTANDTILVTGAAGFIGYHVAQRLLDQGERVVGVDNLNPYYDVSLKEARLARLQAHPRFAFQRSDIAGDETTAALFGDVQPERVIHLAAQAGVRYSLENPHSYIDSNLRGFLNILEGARSVGVKHLVYASSSSVYGANTKQPFSEHDDVSHPISLYAATKRSNELMAHVYAHLFSVPATGLRFFTVYGPWGRPDMALFKFTRGILSDQPIPLYNNGNMTRDFTYIDDAVDAVVAILARPPLRSESWSSDAPDAATSAAPYRLYNIGSHRPVPLLDYISAIETAVGKKARIDYQPLQPGDVLSTYAAVDDLAEAVGFRPRTDVEEGVRKFVEWYREYYQC